MVACIGAEHLAVDVKLALLPRAVSDPDRTAAAPTRQMRQVALRQVTFPADAEHDLQLRVVLKLRGTRIGEEEEELARLVRTGRHPQGLHRQAGVAHAGVAIVPVALAADFFWQRSGRGSHHGTSLGPTARASVSTAVPAAVVNVVSSTIV
jgi:hypothetical protein